MKIRKYREIKNNIKDHIRTLKEYNEWRRGANIQQPNPKNIGKSIDVLTTKLDELINSKIFLNNSKGYVKLEDALEIIDNNWIINGKYCNKCMKNLRDILINLIKE